MQALGRTHPTQPAVPGKPERREQDYIRYGTRALIASFIVPTGELIGDLGPTRTSVDFATHLSQVEGRLTQIKGFDWVLDNLNTHWRLEVCRVIAQLCDVPFEAAVLQTGKQRRAFLTEPTHKHVFDFTPIHGSWLNQVELWFSVFGRRFLKRGDLASMADFEARLLRYVEDYNGCHANQYRWTYTGTPLVRGTTFSEIRRQQRQGRTGLVQGPNSLNASYTHPGRISGTPRKLARDLRNRHLAGRLRRLHRMSEKIDCRDKPMICSFRVSSTAWVLPNTRMFSRPSEEKTSVQCLRNVRDTTSLFSRYMLSSPALGAKQGEGQHGRLCTGNRTEDEAAL